MSGIISNFKHTLFQMIIRGTKAGYRSSRPELFYKKGVLENLAKFTGKHM